jgi:hypothetical protein
LGEGVLTYSLEELTAEKVRALYERARPRDLYDVVYLLRHRGDELSLERVRDILRVKCFHKGLAFPTIQSLIENEKVEALRADWESMLRAQLPALPLFESFWSELPHLLVWLEERPVDFDKLRRVELVETNPAERPTLAALEWVAGETPVPYRSMRPWRIGAPLELIRFAGAHRLCVMFNDNGVMRTVEPYSLRVSTDGNLVLYGWNVEEGDIRSYRVDRLQDLTVTSVSFTPRYRVEF